jgi:hypothetical protein
VSCGVDPGNGDERCPNVVFEDEFCDFDYCDGDFYCDANPPGGGRAICRTRVGENGACNNSSVCGADLVCMDNGRCLRGGQPVGAPCHAFTTTTCASGLFCDTETHTCALPRGEDERCNVNYRSSCEDGLYCACTPEVPCSDPSTGARCKPKLTQGSDCDTPFDCASGVCKGACQACLP